MDLITSPISEIIWPELAEEVDDILVTDFIKRKLHYHYIARDNIMIRHFVFHVVCALDNPILFFDIIKSLIDNKIHMVIVIHIHSLDDKHVHDVDQCVNNCKNIDNVKITIVDDIFHHTVVFEIQVKDTPSHNLRIACRYGSEIRVHAESNIIESNKTDYICYTMDEGNNYHIQDIPFVTTDATYISSVIGHILFYYTSKSDVIIISHYMKQFSLFCCGISFFIIEYFINNYEQSPNLLIEMLDHILVDDNVCRVIANLVVSICINISNIALYTTLINAVLQIHQYVREKYPIYTLDIRRCAIYEYMHMCDIFKSIKIKAPIITDITGINLQHIIDNDNRSNQTIMTRAFEIFSHISPFSTCLHTYNWSNMTYYLYCDKIYGLVYVKISYKSIFIKDVILVFYNKAGGYSRFQCITMWYMCPCDKRQIRYLFDIARKICPTLYPLNI